MIGHTKLLLLVGGAAAAILLLRTLLIPIAHTLPDTQTPLAPMITDTPTNQTPTVYYPTTLPTTPSDPGQITPYTNQQPTIDPRTQDWERPESSCTTNADCGGGCWRCDTTYGRCVTVCNNEP